MCAVLDAKYNVVWGVKSALGVSIGVLCITYSQLVSCKTNLQFKNHTIRKLAI